MAKKKRKRKTTKIKVVIKTRKFLAGVVIFLLGFSQKQIMVCIHMHTV